MVNEAERRVNGEIHRSTGASHQEACDDSHEHLLSCASLYVHPVLFHLAAVYPVPFLNQTNSLVELSILPDIWGLRAKVDHPRQSCPSQPTTGTPSTTILDHLKTNHLRVEIRTSSSHHQTLKQFQPRYQRVTLLISTSCGVFSPRLFNHMWKSF